MKINQFLAQQILLESKPVHRDYHIIRSGPISLLFEVNGSKLIEIDSATDLRLSASDLSAFEKDKIIHSLLDSHRIYVDDTPIQNPKTYAISLAIAQKCNLGCSYCYAAQGEFGEAAKKMDLKVAKQSIDFLLADKAEGDKVQISFMGGEPLMNRKGIYEATEYAIKQSVEKHVTVNFSITTNGTLLTEEDAIFFEKYGFAVTISLDGNKNEHDLLRPMKNGKGTFDIIMNKIAPLLKIQNKMQVSARITVTSENLNVSSTLKEFIAMGFHSVGLSPLINANNHSNELTKEEQTQLLSEMIDCGLEFEKAVMKSEAFPFLNMINAYKEIEKQSHKPYPCGAGAGYLGVSATGELSACHRFVNNPSGEMGNLDEGIDAAKQNSWLDQRHVHNQNPCNTCWARYLCGGGCHHEVIDVGRTSCDYIRGWLTYCLQSYNRVNRLIEKRAYATL